MGHSPGSVVIQSAGEAWAHTRAMLLSRFNLALWLKLGFIAMLGQSVSRGGGNFSVQVPSGGVGEEGPGAEVYGQMVRAAQYVRENIVSLLALIIGLAILWVALVFAIFYIRCVFRFIFVDAVVVSGRRSIRRAWSQHSWQGVSLLLWYLALGLITLVVLALVIVPIVLTGAAAAGGHAGLAALGVGGIVLLVGVVVIVVIVLALVQALTDDLVVPVMYTRKAGVLQAWGHVRDIWGGRFWDIVLYYLLKLAVGLGVAFATLLLLLPMALVALPALASAAGIVALSSAAGLQGGELVAAVAPPLIVGAVVFALAASYLLQCVLLPVSVFYQSYSLAFVGKLDPQLRSIPATGAG